MLNVGASRLAITIEAPTAGTDSMGAPTAAWAAYATGYAELENDTVSQDEGGSTGPRREVIRTATMIMRCHPTQIFSPSMRVVTDAGEIYAITAARYDSRHTRVYLEVQGGQSAGGVP